MGDHVSRLRRRHEKPADYGQHAGPHHLHFPHARTPWSTTAFTSTISTSAECRRSKRTTLPKNNGSGKDIILGAPFDEEEEQEVKKEEQVVSTKKSLKIKNSSLNKSIRPSDVAGVSTDTARAPRRRQRRLNKGPDCQRNRPRPGRQPADRCHGRGRQRHAGGAVTDVKEQNSPSKGQAAGRHLRFRTWVTRPRP